MPTQKFGWAASGLANEPVISFPTKQVHVTSPPTGSPQLSLGKALQVRLGHLAARGVDVDPTTVPPWGSQTGMTQLRLRLGSGIDDDSAKRRSIKTPRRSTPRAPMLRALSQSGMPVHLRASKVKSEKNGWGLAGGHPDPLLSTALSQGVYEASEPVYEASKPVYEESEPVYQPSQRVYEPTGTPAGGAPRACGCRSRTGVFGCAPTRFGLRVARATRATGAGSSTTAPRSAACVQLSSLRSPKRGRGWVRQPAAGVTDQDRCVSSASGRAHFGEGSESFTPNRPPRAANGTQGFPEWNRICD